MGRINKQQLNELKKLYYDDGLCMQEIAERFSVSIDAVVYFMRKHNLKRRSFSEINQLRFNRKLPSFEKRAIDNSYLKELNLAGIMLYWSEGSKSGNKHTVDFANSDPDMIAVFLNFIRKIYQIDENRLRVLLYCHADQDVDKLISFWSSLTNISKKQFSKPYVRDDFKSSGRKMLQGLVHIRYSDKKLFLEIEKSIEECKSEYLNMLG